eukprot:scaffold1150_cov127-Skeletonema_menzelii.AAC.1
MVAVRLQEESWSASSAVFVVSEIRIQLGDFVEYRESTAEYRESTAEYRESTAEYRESTAESFSREVAQQRQWHRGRRQEAKPGRRGRRRRSMMPVLSSLMHLSPVLYHPSTSMEETTTTNTKTKLRLDCCFRSRSCDSASQTMLRHLVHLSNVLMVGIPSNALTVTIVTSLLRQLGGYSNSKQEFGFGSVDYSLPYDKIGQILDEDYPTILNDSVSLEWKHQHS